MRFSALVLSAVFAGWKAIGASAQPVLRYAEVLKQYDQGNGAQPGYTTPDAAIGQPSIGHAPVAAINNDPQSGQPTVVSLGQRGSITLGFDSPIRNNNPSLRNTYGYDLLIWGNCFQGGSAITPEFELGRFQEQGFVEVAQADAGGNPIEWFLILPRIFYDPKQRGPVPRDFVPDELLPPTIDEFGFFVASGDLSTSASRFDGLADSVPVQGSELAKVISSNNVADVVLDDPATYVIEGLGGAGIDLFRAVRQSSAGVPAQADGHFELVYPNRIDLVRITDARTNDVNPGAVGPITTEVDGLIVVPDLRDCHKPFADADGDGDVDMDDFAAFQRCFTGAGNRTVSVTCACFDRDGDGDVDSNGLPDESDFDAFKLCRTRAFVPADPTCGQ